MAEAAHDSEKAQDIESRIKSAMFDRASFFSEQADSLTFEGVRRLLEKDLGLEKHALDTHKRFVKQWLKTCVASVGVDTPSKGQDDTGNNDVSTEGDAEPPNELQAKKEEKEPNSGSGGKMEDSPVMGLMTGTKKSKSDTGTIEDTKSKAVPTEMTIKKAILARASYLRENSENVTLAGLRRLLEEDLELEQHSLDPFKGFIKQQVDEALQPSETQAITVDKKKNTKKVASKSSKVGTSASSGSEGDKDLEDEVKVKKKTAIKRKPRKSEPVKKRKSVDEVIKGAKKKQRNMSKSASEVSSEEDGGAVSEDGNSEASAEKPVKKKEVPKPSYGRQVERLKSVIKSCGMSVPPSIYKKVKEAPENKREARLIKELEDILAKEGLSANPSEKEIKDVKKRKERARELEGIDLSNIVSSSRRRSTTSFIPPPKPTIPDISESESESEESENEEEEDAVDEEEEDAVDEEVKDAVDEDVDEAVDEQIGDDAVGGDQENGDTVSQKEETEKDKRDSD